MESFEETIQPLPLQRESMLEPDKEKLRRLTFPVVDYLFEIGKDLPDDVIREAVRAVRDGAPNEQVEAILNRDIAPEQRVSAAELAEIRKIVDARNMSSRR